MKIDKIILIIIVWSFLILASCAVSKNETKNKDMIEQEPLYVFDKVQKDETATAKNLGCGDFFLRFTILTETERGRKQMKHFLAHFIPEENNCYFVADQLLGEGYSYLDSSGMEVWHDIISPDSPMKLQGRADELPVYSELLKYYKTNKSTIEVLKQECNDIENASK